MIKTNTGVDECMIWGDYFYLEALTRLAKAGILLVIHGGKLQK